MSAYVPRLVDPRLERMTQLVGAVSLVGPRACGKTRTARRLAASSVYLTVDSPDHAAASLSLDEALDGPTPRLLDEWQNIPALWEGVRRRVDESDDRGLYLLTGSAWPSDDPRRHSGAGRIASLTMRTMSLYESGESTGEISLAALMGNEMRSAESPQTLRDVVDALVRGGWPGGLDLRADDAVWVNRAYLAALGEREFPLISGSRRVPEQFGEFIGAYAALVAQPAAYRAVERRISEQGQLRTTQTLVPDMHECARRLFVVEDQPAWTPQVRSRTTALATPKRHLVDPSLACAALNLRTDRLLRDPETLGLFFESLVVRDLRCYAEASDLRGVFHYRDQKARDEFDVVVEDHDGSWIGVEVKLGWNAVARAAHNLQRVAAKMTRPPTALVVVVPEGRAMRTDDGVIVAPIGALGP